MSLAASENGFIIRGPGYVNPTGCNKYEYDDGSFNYTFSSYTAATAIHVGTGIEATTCPLVLSSTRTDDIASQVKSITFDRDNVLTSLDFAMYNAMSLSLNLELVSSGLYQAMSAFSNAWEPRRAGITRVCTVTLDTPSLFAADSMFYGGRSIATVYGMTSLSSLTYAANMFYGCGLQGSIRDYTAQLAAAGAPVAMPVESALTARTGMFGECTGCIDYTSFYNSEDPYVYSWVR